MIQLVRVERFVTAFVIPDAAAAGASPAGARPGRRRPRIGQEPARCPKPLAAISALETIDGVTVVSFVDTKIVTEENIQEVGDQLYSLVEDDGHSGNSS